MVVFLVEDPDSASARTRGRDLVEGLSREGVAARVEGIARGPLARRRQIAGLATADVVVLGRKLLGERDLARLRRAARTLVFDIDDALPERPSDSRKGRSSWTRPRRFADALRAADMVVVGSAALRDLAAGHPRVRVLPVAVRLPENVPSRGRGDGVLSPVRLVWTGSRATLGYLDMLRTPLAALARKRPQVLLEVVADARPGLDATFTPWTLEEEERALARADVGIMPLGSDPWSRGKCGLKVALYMAWGLPVVSSRFGAGAELVDAPRTGLLADDEGEWLHALEALVSDPDRRHELGARARAEAIARLSLDGRVRSWAAVLREASGLSARSFDGGRGS
jgi:glycosyltransferase involved in cell wall biosynthesis